MGLTEQDMVEGYRDGFRDERDALPDSLANRGASYRHGWQNGRDDRMGRPRAAAVDLRREARDALLADRGLEA